MSLEDKLGMSFGLMVVCMAAFGLISFFHNQKLHEETMERIQQLEINLVETGSRE